MLSKSPYTLRTLASPELRAPAFVMFAGLGISAAVTGAGVADGSLPVTAIGLLGVTFGVYALGELDERAREVAAEA